MPSGPAPTWAAHPAPRSPTSIHHPSSQHLPALPPWPQATAQKHVRHVHSNHQRRRCGHDFSPHRLPPLRHSAQWPGPLATAVLKPHGGCAGVHPGHDLSGRRPYRRREAAGRGAAGVHRHAGEGLGRRGAEPWFGKGVALSEHVLQWFEGGGGEIRSVASLVDMDAYQHQMRPSNRNRHEQMCCDIHSFIRKPLS